METLDIWDMNAAAYLLTQDIELLGVVREGPGKWASFRFRNDDGHASQALSEWARGKATVNLQRFVTCYKRIKQVTFAAA